MQEVYTGDLRELVVGKGGELVGDDPVRIFCPKHDDKNRPSMAVYAHGAKCFTCGVYLHPDEFSQLFSDRELASAKILSSTITRRRANRANIDPLVAATSAHDALMEEPALHEWLGARGINLRMVQQYQLGHNGIAYTLPVWESQDGPVVTVRYRRDDEVAPHLFKFWGLKGINQTYLYPYRADEDVVILTEGEMDALLLRRYGLPAYSFTNGNQAVPTPDELDAMLPNVKRILLARDQDAPGKEGAEKLEKKLAAWDPAVQVVNEAWPLEWGKDVTALWQGNFNIFDTQAQLLRKHVEA